MNWPSTRAAGGRRSLASIWRPLFCSLLLTGCTPKAPPERSSLIFTRDLHSFMATYCIECHGRNAQEAGLDLRSIQAMMKGGESGPALVPGQPDESLLLTMILDSHMPPDGQMPNRREIDLLTRWILHGAN